MILIPINAGRVLSYTTATLCRTPRVLHKFLQTQVRGNRQDQKTSWDSEMLAVQRALFPNFSESKAR